MTCRKWPRMRAVAESPPTIAPTMKTATTPDTSFHLPFRLHSLTSLIPPCRRSDDEIHRILEIPHRELLIVDESAREYVREQKQRDDAGGGRKTPREPPEVQPERRSGAVDRSASGASRASPIRASPSAPPDNPPSDMRRTGAIRARRASPYFVSCVLPLFRDKPLEDCAQLLPRSICADLHVDDAPAEQLGGLRHRPLLDMNKLENRAILGRELAESPREELARLAARRAVRVRPGTIAPRSRARAISPDPR